MNVAVTRGRRHVALIGDSETAAAHPFLARMVHHFEEHGEVFTAAEFGESSGGGGRGGGGGGRGGGGGGGRGGEGGEKRAGHAGG